MARNRQTLTLIDGFPDHVARPAVVAREQLRVPGLVYKLGVPTPQVCCGGPRQLGVVGGVGGVPDARERW